MAFQKFLMEFSVRPGRRLVILDQWLPTTAWHWASRNSSSKDQLPLRRQRGKQQHGVYANQNSQPGGRAPCMYQQQPGFPLVAGKWADAAVYCGIGLYCLSPSPGCLPHIRQALTPHCVVES